MRFAPMKNEGQLELQAIQRIRERMMHNRTALINQTRGVLAEHGVVIGKSPVQFKKYLSSGKLDDISKTIGILVQELGEELKVIEKQISGINKKLLERAKVCPVDKRDIP